MNTGISSYTYPGWNTEETIPLKTRTVHNIGKSLRHAEVNALYDAGAYNKRHHSFIGTFHYMRTWNGVCLTSKEVSALYSKRLSVNPFNSINTRNFNTLTTTSRTLPETELILDSTSPGWVNTTSGFNTYKIFFWDDKNNRAPPGSNPDTQKIKVSRFKIYGRRQTNAIITDLYSTKDRWRTGSETQRQFISLPRPTWPTKMHLLYKTNTENVEVNFPGTEQQTNRFGLNSAIEPSTCLC